MLSTVAPPFPTIPTFWTPVAAVETELPPTCARLVWYLLELTPPAKVARLPPLSRASAEVLRFVPALAVTVPETVTVAAEAAKFTLRLFVLLGVSFRLTRSNPEVSRDSGLVCAVVYDGAEVVTAP